MSQGTAPATHASAKQFEFRVLMANGATVNGKPIDLGLERQRLLAWLDKDRNRDLLANFPSSIHLYHALGDAEGGRQCSELRWAPHTLVPLTGDVKAWSPSHSSMAVGLFTAQEFADGPSKAGARPFLVEYLPINLAANSFTGDDLDPEGYKIIVDSTGNPALQYRLKLDRAAAFGEWTAGLVDQHLAVSWKGRVLSAPRIVSRVPGLGVISSAGTRADFEEIVRTLGLAKPADAKTIAKPGTTGEAKPPVPTQVPASADPADIRAIQSAQAMLDAEKRLRQLIKDGKIDGVDQILTFEEISSWPYQDGLKGMPKSLEKLSGKTVMMTGFMLPIDEVENIKEFLLVQSLWSCCYGQPPDINGIVRVVMKNKRIDYSFEPLKITGTFKVVASYEDNYCVDIYQLHADTVEVIQ